MFLLRTWESLDIKIDSVNKSLKPLLSQHRIIKSLKSLSWLCSKRWSETADGFHSTPFPVKCDMPMCSVAQNLLSFAIVSNIAVTTGKSIYYVRL